MKKLIIFTILIVSNSLIFGQKSQDISNHFNCSHAKHFNKQIQFNRNIQNDLLQDYDVKFYFLDLNVENNTVYISGNVRIDAVSQVVVLDTFAFELVQELTVDSIIFNDDKLNFFHEDDYVFVPLINPLLTGENISANIFYHGMPPTGGFFSGVTTAYSEDWDKNVTWTLSEPFNANQWLPCKQNLQDKADSVWVFLTTDSTNKAGSEGLLTAVTPMPNGKLRYEWKSKYPIDYYLISFSVADYIDYSIYAKPEAMNGDSLLIQNFIYDSPGCLEHYKAGIDRTKEFIELFSDLYSLYPFHEEKYGHCLSEIPGGMEHQTMTTIGYFGFGIVAHELGHMWFGDNVTCATWSDIWVNEGFATYTDYLAHEFIAGAHWPQLWLEIVHNHVLSETGGSIYIPVEETDSIGRIFDGRLSYNKGASIIHMIRFELQDDDLFFEVLQNFQSIYADSTATGLDFLSVLNETSGMDFTEFFNQWYFGEGYPIYDIIWNQNEDNFILSSTQTTSTETITLFNMLMEYKLYFTDDSDTSLFLFQENNLESYTIPINKSIDSISVDPDNWNIKLINSIIHGIEEIQNPIYFTLGPIPAKDVLHLNFVNKNIISRNIIITDISGKEIMKISTTKAYEKIYVNDLSRGIYFITVRNDNNIMTKKFIIN
ncbi:MAG: T9SS type A sorting domain-containing protein [Bacteroidales bacterium]|nr:T9SS type A sorting domain-containing protein [Bacteroidales bacterium]